MRYELKSIPLWPVTKVAFFVNLAVGFVMGLLAAIFMMPFVAMMASVAAYDAGELDFDSGALSALTMMIPFLTALWSAFFNTVLVAIVILAYNLVTRLVGGIELRLDLVELEPIAPPQATPPPGPAPEPPPPDPVGPPPESIAPPPAPPVTDRPQPPPPVITQPEPKPPEATPPAPGEDSSDGADDFDDNFKE